jgi:outer membrane receptor protein involved in Fe transport
LARVAAFALCAVMLLGSGAAFAAKSTLKGVVSDASSKKPVADVFVTVLSPSMADEKTAVSDAEGKYQVEGLPAGTFTVKFEGPGYALFQRGDVTLGENAEIRFDVELLPMEGTLEEVVVTGTRLPRADVDRAAPVTVVSREKIQSAGRASVGDLLQNLPEQTGGTNTQVNNGGDGSTRVDLRGLGSQRTLVLVNGRRHVAGGTGANASVDLNTIPTQAIQRVEILKDGASAVYGSDALAGVVNIITRNDFQGSEVGAYSGISQRGDGLVYDLNFTTGQVTEKGNILFSAGYYQQRDVMAGQRAFSRFDRAYDFASRGISTLGSTVVPATRLSAGGTATGNSAWSDLKSQYPDAGAFVWDKGSWRPFSASGITEAGGDLYNYQPENYLVTPLQRANLFATGAYRLFPDAQAYFEASYTNRQSDQKLAPEPLSTVGEGIAVSKDSIYNPFGRDFGDVRRRLTEFGRRSFVQDLDTFRVVGGMKGEIPRVSQYFHGWSWDVSLNYGRTQGVETKEGLLQRSKVAAAVGPSFIDPSTNQPTCGTPDAPIDGCVPLNLMGGPGSISQDMKNYLSYKGTQRGLNQQIILGGYLSGEVMQLSSAATPVALAMGLEHRREYGSSIPDPLTAKGDTTGNKQTETTGGYNVNEAFAELAVPLLARPASLGGGTGNFLEVSGAIRAVSYSSFGTNSTYKLESRISPVTDITFRGTYSTAFRAPSVAELYSGSIDGFPEVADPCSDRAQGSNQDRLCDAQGIPDDYVDDRAQQLTKFGGNTQLKPERANAFTAGIAFQPRWVKDLTFTGDFYSVAVNDAISSVGADIILASCYPGDGSAPQYCDRIHRNGDGLIMSIDDPLSNVGGDRTSGIDLALNYEPVTSFGRIALGVNLNYLINFDRTLAGDQVVRARGTYDLGIILPDWKGTVNANWSNGPYNAGLALRWINGFKECEGGICAQQDPSAPPLLSRRVNPYYAVDLSAGYRLVRSSGNATTFQLGINNVFDRVPNLIANGSSAASDPTAYDFMGRYWYLRLTHTL